MKHRAKTTLEYHEGSYEGQELHWKFASKLCKSPKAVQNETVDLANSIGQESDEILCDLYH